ncbi:MAG: ABC-F family ATP-binding cassette domain-containing protein, partial [Tidjanibacter sp.]|nr:ABC-F family ATP-binding cassette domain-containing protein [Tidjanibacter sp.]
GYYAQNQDDLMDGNFTVYDTLDRVAVGDIRTRLRDILGAFLFRGEDVDKKVKVLSGGERSRLAMARMMLSPHNLLVLDEPTNHMDMRSKDILKQALLDYDGTLVVVSHDREFLDGLVDKVYEFRDGGVKEYLGGIYYFIEKRRLASLAEVERRAPEERVTNSAEPSRGKQDYLQKKEQERQVRRTRSAIEAAEKRIEELEGEVADWEKRMADPAAHGIDLSDPAHFKAYNDTKQRLAEAEHEWEKLNYELEILTDNLY